MMPKGIMLTDSSLKTPVAIQNNQVRFEEEKQIHRKNVRDRGPVLRGFYVKIGRQAPEG